MLNSLLVRAYIYLKRRFYFYFRRCLVDKYNCGLFFSQKKDFVDFFVKTKFLFAVSNLDELKGFYGQQRDYAGKIIINANNISNHYFDLLGTGKYDFGEVICWCKDVKSGFEWSNTFFKNIRVIDICKGCDVKNPWELSRFYHLLTLGRAFVITEDIKYYREFKNQISDWIEKNPVEKSVNWTCAMEVAIRACNWIFAYNLFYGELYKDSEFRSELDASLFEHGRFVYRYQEKSLRSDIQGNHYISNLVGLVFIGLHFSGYKKEADRWLTYAISELDKEILSQVSSDGVNIETSTGYHRLVLEQLLFIQLILEKNGFTFGEKQKKRLLDMCYFVYSITNEAGVAPLVGDYDSGRLFIFEDYFNWSKINFSTVLSLCDWCFKTNYRKGKSLLHEELGLFLGKYIEDDGKQQEKSVVKSCKFPDGGFYVLRNSLFNCLIRCGKVAPTGAHSHNDQLSFTLFVYDKSFIIDPGTYVYTANKTYRDLFRSTDYHNTLCVENVEQNDYNKLSNNCFRMPEETYAKCLHFDELSFKGEHSGYKNKIGVVHRRFIRISDRKFYIEDNVLGDKCVKYSNLILDKDVDIEVCPDGILLKKENVILKVFLNDYKISNKYISEGYGYIQETKVIKYKEDTLLIEIVN